MPGIPEKYERIVDASYLRARIHRVQAVHQSTPVRVMQRREEGQSKED